MGWLQSVIWAFGFAVAAYVLVALAVFMFQRQLIYKPDPRRTTPIREGFFDVEELRIPTADGQVLVAWHARALPGQPTLLYFHGNAGYIELRNERLKELKSRGYGVLMPSLRGYGGSSGMPTEDAAFADAKLLYQCLRNSGIAAEDIIVFGESLGTAIATQLAASRKVGALALDSPFTSMIDLAEGAYPWLPVRRMLLDRFETAHHIKRVTVPLLVIHGEADTLVPVQMGRAVYEAAASQQKTLITYPGASHLEHLALGSFEDVERWIASLPGGARAASPVSHLYPWYTAFYEVKTRS